MQKQHRVSEGGRGEGGGDGGRGMEEHSRQENSTEKKQRLEFTFTKGTPSVARVEKLRWEKIQT